MPSKTGPGLRIAGVLAPVDPAAWRLSTLPRWLSICSATVAMVHGLFETDAACRNGCSLRQRNGCQSREAMPNFQIWFFLQSGFSCNFDIECNELVRHHIP
jgi:hypothetical protein